MSLSKKLIKIKSIPDMPGNLEKALGVVLSELPTYTIERFEKNGVKSALIYNTKKRPDRFKIILNGHLDVISGKERQFKPYIKRDRLYGVGAMDMKANLACLTYVFIAVAKQINYPLALQLVTDEEVGGYNGTKLQIDKGIRADFIIAGESTNFNIVNKAKGTLWIEIISKGRAAHGAYPWRGENAVWKMYNFLTLLQQRYPTPIKEKWITTVNLSSIRTNNQTFNKIPDDCEVCLDIRYIPRDRTTILKDLKKLLPKGFRLRILENGLPLLTEESNTYVHRLRKITDEKTNNKTLLYGAQGTSDARHYTEVGCDAIEFGPIGGGIGSDNEWVDIPSLEMYTLILKDFLLGL